MIGVIFANQGDCATGGEYQESKAGYFQPELVSNSGKVLQRGAGAADDGAKGPAALYLLPCYPGGYSELARG